MEKYMVNFYPYKLGVSFRLADGELPSKFFCQKKRRKQNISKIKAAYREQQRKCLDEEYGITQPNVKSKVMKNQLVRNIPVESSEMRSIHEETDYKEPVRHGTETRQTTNEYLQVPLIKNSHGEKKYEFEISISYDEDSNNPILNNIIPKHDFVKTEFPGLDGHLKENVPDAAIIMNDDMDIVKIEPPDSDEHLQISPNSAFVEEVVVDLVKPEPPDCDGDLKETLSNSAISTEAVGTVKTEPPDSGNQFKTLLNSPLVKEVVNLAKPEPPDSDEGLKKMASSSEVFTDVVEIVKNEAPDSSNSALVEVVMDFAESDPPSSNKHCKTSRNSAISTTEPCPCPLDILCTNNCDPFRENGKDVSDVTYPFFSQSENRCSESVDEEDWECMDFEYCAVCGIQLPTRARWVKHLKTHSIIVPKQFLKRSRRRRHRKKMLSHIQEENVSTKQSTLDPGEGTVLGKTDISNNEDFSTADKVKKDISTLINSGLDLSPLISPLISSIDQQRKDLDEDTSLPICMKIRIPVCVGVPESQSFACLTADIPQSGINGPQFRCLTCNSLFPSIASLSKHIEVKMLHVQTSEPQLSGKNSNSGRKRERFILPKMPVENNWYVKYNGQLVSSLPSLSPSLTDL